MLKSFKSHPRRRRDSHLSAVSLETYRAQAQALDLAERPQGSQTVGESSAHFYGALYQAYEKSSANVVVQGIGRSHGQIWASITTDRRGWTAGEHFKKQIAPALRACKQFEGMPDIANFLIKQDAAYRKVSPRQEGLFVGTSISASIVDLKKQVVYNMRRGPDCLLSIDPSEEQSQMVGPISPSERTTVKFPDYEVTIERCSFVGLKQLIVVVGSPALWELVSNTRAAVKLRHMSHSTDSAAGQSHLASQLVTIALQQVMQQMARSGDRRFYTLDSLEALQQLKPGQASKNRHNVYQRMRGDVHGDLAAVVITLDVNRSHFATTSSADLRQAILSQQRTQRRRVSRWLHSVPSMNSIHSMGSDMDEGGSLTGSPGGVGSGSPQHAAHGASQGRWAILRAHVWSDVEVKRNVRRKWVTLLYDALTEANIGKDDGIIRPYVNQRYREMSRLRPTMSALALDTQ